MGLLKEFNGFLNRTLFLPEPFDPYNIARLAKLDLIYELNGIYHFREPHEVSASRWAICCAGCNSVCEMLDYASDRCRVLCFAADEAYNKRLLTVLSVRKGSKLLKGVRR